MLDIQRKEIIKEKRELIEMKNRRREKQVSGK